MTPNQRTALAGSNRPLELSPAPQEDEGELDVLRSAFDGVASGTGSGLKPDDGRRRSQTFSLDPIDEPVIWRRFGSLNRWFSLAFGPVVCH
ncbi:MAG TPA: hypothetical protein VJB57_13415 [Dehalococcoidia bacterium]|nr:hypothetical protein [Dehalococcoidia bacterium]